MIGILSVLIALLFSSLEVKQGKRNCGNAFNPKVETVFTEKPASKQNYGNKYWISTKTLCPDEITKRRITSSVLGGIGVLVFFFGHKIVTFGETPKPSNSCSNCGEKLTIGAKFCSGCGATV